MSIYQNILKAKQAGRKLLAVLIDPEKISISNLSLFFEKIHQSVITHVFVGGSTDKDAQIQNVVEEIKKLTSLPIIIFPGDVAQITDKADGILFLSLLSGRNPKYLIDQQIKAVPALEKGSLEIIPTGYILIDGGKETATQKVSNTKPITQNNLSLIRDTAMAGEFLGKKLIYLEAGSGAKNPVNSKVITSVKKQLSIPLIVGGGIKNKKQLDLAYQAGADLVVIGTAFENDHTFLKELKK